MPINKEDRAFSTLLKDLAQQTSTLVRQEAKLVIAEMSQKKDETQRNLAALAAGVGLLLVGFIYILDAVVYGIAELLPPDYSPWLAALIVGVLVSIIGYILIAISKPNLEPGNLAPKAADSLERDKEMIKEKFNGK